MKITPINMAEAIIEPFWDPQLSGLKKWQIDDGSGHGLEVSQNWCFVTFDWSKKPCTGPALRMSRRFDINCAGYDLLMVSIMAPEKSVLHISVLTEKGNIIFESPPSPSLKKEYTVDLKGASEIRSITFEVYAGEEGISSGWFNWIGLQNSSLLERYLAQWRRFDSNWEDYIKPENYQPDFEPYYEVFVDKEDLKLLREEHENYFKENHTSPFIQQAKKTQKLVPEKMIGEYVNFWTDTRYNRERDHGKYLLTNGLNAAVAGILLRDARLLRLGARFAMSIAMCTHWDDGMICCLPGGVFEHRCFVQSLCIHELAWILDLAGDLFTDLGREYLLRRIAEEGMGNVNFITWKHEYIFHNNQMMWFSSGRMAGYVILEKHMCRVGTYMDLAYKDVVENLNNTILADGGFVEGPTYFGCVGVNGCSALYYYARARSGNYRELIPEKIMKTADFAEAIYSSDEEADVIPICDARPYNDMQHLAFMASLMPQSRWVSIFRKALERKGGMVDNLLAFVLKKSIPVEAPDIKSFIKLPEMGLASSARIFRGEIVKLLLMGNKAGAGHTHEDKGSFVLEFAGETFAADPGTCDYANPLSVVLKHCERHNMLVPYGFEERPRPVNPIPCNVIPECEGDHIEFSARMDVTPGWEGYYRKWIREWYSDTPGLLAIRDTYELEKGNGVDFYWNTQCDVQICRNKAVLTGKRGKMEVITQEDCVLHLEMLPMPEGKLQNRIAIRKEGVSGSLEVVVKLV